MIETNKTIEPTEAEVPKNNEAEVLKNNEAVVEETVSEKIVEASIEKKEDAVIETDENMTKIEEKPIPQTPTRIKRHLEKPLSKKEKKKRVHKEIQHEKAFDERMYKEKTKRSFRMNVLFGLLITFGTLMLFKYVLNIDMSTVLEKFMAVSLFVSGGLFVLSMIILLTDRTSAQGASDPITDYFIINRGRVMGSTKKRHLDRVNTRFIMVTLLKLYQKEQIAIVNEKIVYGTMEGDLSKDEVALLNFMLDHNVTTVDEFIDTVSRKDNRPVHRKDQLYAKYKESIIEMANEKNYINNSINKAKFVLRVGAIAYAVVVLALLSKGQGTLLMIGVYSLQAIALFLTANLLYANSKGAHQRIKKLRKEKRMLQSAKAEIYTALIYNYLFGKEDKVIKRIQKQYENNQISSKEYQKFSETYNGFNYILDFIKYENVT